MAFPFHPSTANVPFVRPRYEVADIRRKYGDDYRTRHSLPIHTHRVLNAIENCRTAALGGHEDICTECGTLHSISVTTLVAIDIVRNAKDSTVPVGRKHEKRKYFRFPIFM